MMTKDDIKRFFNITDILDFPAAVMELLSSPNRDDKFRELARFNNNDYSTEWFQTAFEEELAQRKSKGADFTNMKVASLLAIFTRKDGNKCSYHEPTAGNGGLLIAKWWDDCLRQYPFTYKPSLHTFTCWELSHRSIPILLLNLAIRGMTGTVWHGDVLTQEVIARYDLINPMDSFASFSDIYKTTIYDDI